MRTEVIGNATLHQGDCRDVLRKLDADSIDAIVTDPPYGLGFMGKGWDHAVPGVEYWQEMLRVAKPGAHLLAFGGTRTHHRMMCAIEDAGWELRDTIMWIYGSGMPKSYNLARSPEIFCHCHGNALPCSHEGTQQKAEHEVPDLRGTDVSAPENIGKWRRTLLQSGMPEQSTSEHGIKATIGVDDRREEPCLEGRTVHRAGQGLCDGTDAEPSKSKSQRLCVGAHPCCGKDVGPATDGSRRSTSQESPASRQSPGEPEGVCEPSGALDGRALSGCGRCARCGKLTESYLGYGTALKPAYEPIIVARKPLDGTVAANVLRYGVGALNIDACRVPGTKPDTTRGAGGRNGCYGEIGAQGRIVDDGMGRWPANVIHDGSDEVLASFPWTTSGSGNKNPGNRGNGVTLGHGLGRGNGVGTGGDEGRAARFFYCAKASKTDRDEGLDDLPAVVRANGNKWTDQDYRVTSGARPATRESGPRKNTHPTVKPTDLMRYLCRLVTPPGGVVLDPFAGSGSTGKAALLEGFRFVGIELSAEYAEVAAYRLTACLRQGRLIA